MFLDQCSAGISRCQTVATLDLPLMKGEVEDQLRFYNAQVAVSATYGRSVVTLSRIKNAKYDWQ